MTSCMTCGMPFTGNHEKDVGLETAEGTVCVYDVKDGVMKSPEDIFEGGVEFFLHAAAEGDRALAERLTRKNMNSLSYWQAYPFDLLNGDAATEEEFGAAMQKVM